MNILFWGLYETFSVYCTNLNFIIFHIIPTKRSLNKHL